MGHGHHHGHGAHAHPQASATRTFAWVTLINLSYTVVEAGYGFHTNSLALLSDALHNLGDVLGLDGATSTDINPTHLYAAPGAYNVLLTATSNNGCVDTLTQTVTVSPIFLMVSESYRKMLPGRTSP